MGILANQKWALLALLIAQQSLAQSDKISPVLERNWQAQPQQACWVKMRQQADLSPCRALGGKEAKAAFAYQALLNASQSQQRVKNILDGQGIDYQSFWVVNGLSVQLDQNSALALAQLEEVERILPNAAISSHPLPPNPPALKSGDGEYTWGLSNLQAPQLWAKGVKGQGVVIGGQDTGYDWLHPALQPRYRGWDGSQANHHHHWHDAIHSPHPLNSDSLNPCGFSVSSPCDDGSHGTHTMGTMIGSDDGETKLGVAPQAQWIGCRNMERGWGLPSTYIECFEWFAAPTDLNGQNPQPALAPHVINNSWGCPDVENCHPDNFEMMRLAVANLRAAGTVVVVSAGNDGPDCHTVQNPAAIFAESFSVGAIDKENQVASFSSRGSVSADGSFRLKPNVVAPGVGVFSTLPNGGFGYASGTSMSGPHVAGLVALLISAEPSLAGDVDRIEELLMYSAVPVVSQQVCDGISPAEIPNPIFGYGRVSGWAALAMIRPDLVGSQANPEAIRLYPNPVGESATLISPVDMGENTQIRIFNPIGQLVWSQVASFQRIHTVEISHLQAGIYFIELQQGEQKPQRVGFYKK